VVTLASARRVFLKARQDALCRCPDISIGFDTRDETSSARCADQKERPNRHKPKIGQRTSEPQACVGARAYSGRASNRWMPEIRAGLPQEEERRGA